MKKLAKFKSLFRATFVIGAVASLVTAVTMSALTASATLSANTLSSATADLLIKNGTGTPTANTDTGFTMNDIVPGGAASGPHTFTLKNNGGVALGVTVYATNSTVTGTLDNNKVHFCFTRVTGGPSTDCFTRAQMLANFNNLPGGPLASGSGDIQYDLNVSMDADAVTGGSASVAPFDMVFTGTQQ